jgi:hypothetical protein
MTVGMLPIGRLGYDGGSGQGYDRYDDVSRRIDAIAEYGERSRKEAYDYLRRREQGIAEQANQRSPLYSPGSIEHRTSISPPARQGNGDGLQCGAAKKVP